MYACLGMTIYVCMPRYADICMHASRLDASPCYCVSATDSPLFRHMALQHTCRILVQYTATYYSSNELQDALCNKLKLTATYCSTLQHTATHYNVLRHSAAQCSTLQLVTAASQYEHTDTHFHTNMHTYTHALASS